MPSVLNEWWKKITHMSFCVLLNKRSRCCWPCSPFSDWLCVWLSRICLSYSLASRASVTGRENLFCSPWEWCISHLRARASVASLSVAAGPSQEMRGPMVVRRRSRAAIFGCVLYLLCWSAVAVPLMLNQSYSFWPYECMAFVEKWEVRGHEQSTYKKGKNECGIVECENNHGFQ